MSTLSALPTPAAVIDVPRMQHNIERMQSRMNTLGVRFRPHVKTAKSVDVARAQLAAGACGITVSTLKEAEQFLAAGVRDILYAVGMVPAKLPQVLALCQRGADIKIVADSVQSALAIARFGSENAHRFEVWIEIDSDAHRSGVRADDPALVEIGRTLAGGGMVLGGVMTHAGSSYDLDTPDALRAMAEQERSACVLAAQRLRAAGLPCPVVSVGSTPTALSAEHLDGVTEVRAGVYVFFDLVMLNVGVCAPQELALSVLATVIGHQHEKGWAIVDAGWMAMSRDRGTQKQRRDFHYGQVCTADGQPLEGYAMLSANQEHGILGRVGSVDGAIAERLPLGTVVRILPNHACATGAQFPTYHALAADGSIQAWPRFYGW